MIDRKNQVAIDVLLTSLYPGFRPSGPFAFPDPVAAGEEIAGVSHVTRVSFGEIKLAAGRLQDFADVVALIRAWNLDEAFAERLHPAVRKDYRECVDEAREEQRREDKYFAQE